MKTISSLVLVLALAAAAACAPKVNDAADVAAVKATMEAFTKAINAKDAAASVSALTDKTVWLEAHVPSMVGKDAVAKFIQPFFVQYKSLDLVTAVSDVRVTGNLAVMHGTFNETDVPVDESRPTEHASGNWMIALTKQADGAWKWDTFMVNSDQPTPGTTADGAEEQALIQVEKEWAAAMLKVDPAALDRILGKEWVENADGELTTRGQAMAAFKSGALKFESLALRDLSVYVFGDVALATMTADIKGTFMGKPMPPLQRSTDVFVKRDGRWQVVSTQNTTIKQ
jgi:uncharacterized protein (TIGR02246 family)